MADRDANTWQIDLFGTLRIQDPLGRPWPVSSRKSAELLAFLAMRRTPVVERDVVAEALWPEADIITGRNRLKATLSILKREVSGLPIVAYGKRFIELARDQVVIDYELCERRLKWRRSLSGPGRAAFAKQLLQVARHGLLEDVNAPWVIYERDRYTNLCRELEQDVEAGGPNVEARFRLDDQLGGVEIPMVGRSSEFAQLETWLVDSGSRRMHVVGMPGVGKTRLIRETLQSAAHSCDASIALSTVQTSEVPWLDRLGQNLGIQKPEEVTKALTQLLAGFRHPLLALDDIDQASPEMLTWVEHVMSAVPHLKLLGSARRRPSDPSVVVCDLSPLAEQAEGTATDLLIDFARHFGVRQADLEASRETLTEIARHLDGLPLALEIAAAWLPIVDPMSLKNKLGSSPELITKRAGAGRDSLADCVTAICDQLEAEDRDALACLCLCRGGCGEALAEEMLGPNWLWRVRTLVERSLALKVEGHAENRFLVVQALREAVLSVESQERIDLARQNWRDACLSLGERAYFEVNERDRRRWLQWLRDEGDNIVAACSETTADKALLAKAIDLLDRMGAPFWLIGQLKEYRRVYKEILALGLERFPENDAATPVAVVESRVEALTSSGKQAEAIHLSAGHRLALEEQVDPLRLALALDNEGDARTAADDIEGAVECWNRCSAMFEEAGYSRHAVWIESKLIGAELRLGRFSDARSRRELALERAKALGDDNSVGIYLKVYAVNALEDRQFEEAIQLAESAVEAFRRAGETVTLSHALVVLANTYVASNNLDAAREALREALELDPNPNDEYRVRQALLSTLIAAQADGRLFYDHLVGEQ